MGLLIAVLRGVSHSSLPPITISIIKQKENHPAEAMELLDLGCCPHGICLTPVNLFICSFIFSLFFSYPFFHKNMVWLLFMVLSNGYDTRSHSFLVGLRRFIFWRKEMNVRYKNLTRKPMRWLNSKGFCHQAWKHEFNHWDPIGES